jgi:preprotein translocase subunit SecD
VAPASGNVSRPGRAVAVLVALIVVLFLAMVGSDVFKPASWGTDFRPHLGLDLTSGTTVSLKAQTAKGTTPSTSDMTQARQIMENRVNGAGFTGAQVQTQGSNIITVAVPGKGSQDVVNLVGQTANLLFRQVLLVAPNTSAATPTPSASASPSATPSPSVSAKSNVSPKASASSSAHAAGAPGAAVPGSAQEMASRTRALPAATASPSATPAASASPSTSASATTGLSTVSEAQGNASLVSAPVKALFNKLNCADKNWKQQVGYTAQPPQYDNPNTQIVACDASGLKYVLDKTKVLGKDVSAGSASATLITSSVYWQVNFNFDGTGTKYFGQLTTEQFDKYWSASTSTATSPLDQTAIVLDGDIIEAPQTQAAIVTGQTQITGPSTNGFTQTQATSLANVLNYGALPLNFQEESVASISPTLGHDQLTAGLLAGAIGLILVVCYCLLYYRGLAVVAVSSLAIAATLIFESVIALGKHANFTLTLSGIAGLIVAIGITADSFVVFFERLRDEVREGRTLRTAVERGWKRARRTILVSDTVSFLAAALLYFFSETDVKGFAFTLGLTTIVDVIVVFLFTKPTVTLLARTKFYGQGHRLSGLDPARLGARAPWRGSSPRPAVGPARTSAKEA